LHFHQELTAENRQVRVEAAINLLGLIEHNPEFLQNLFVSDEAHFEVNGNVNTQNCRFGLGFCVLKFNFLRYWSETNEHIHRERPLHSQRLTVWAAVGMHGIIGPFFTRDSITGDFYLELLRDHVLPELQGHPAFDRLVFMQDGAPPHYATIVRDWLDEHFPLRWIGRGSPINMAPIRWPPYSPDLTPMDFWLWGYVKSRIYATQPDDLDELEQRITDIFDDIRGNHMDMVGRVFNGFVERLERCIENGGKNVDKC
jgi:hypothetical protein